LEDIKDEDFFKKSEKAYEKKKFEEEKILALIKNELQYVDKEMKIRKRNFVLKGLNKISKGIPTKKLSVRERADNFILNDISNIPSESSEEEKNRKNEIRLKFFEQKKSELLGKLTARLLEKKEEEGQMEKKKRKKKKRYKSEDVKILKKSQILKKTKNIEKNDFEGKTDFSVLRGKKRSMSISSKLGKMVGKKVKKKKRRSSKVIRRSTKKLTREERVEKLNEQGFENVLDNFVKNMKKDNESNHESSVIKNDSRIARIVKKREEFEKLEKIKKKKKEEEMKELEFKEHKDKVIEWKKKQKRFIRPKLSFSIEIQNPSFSAKNSLQKKKPFFNQKIGNDDKLRAFLEGKLSSIDNKGILTKKRKKKKSTKIIKKGNLNFMERLKKEKKQNSEILKGNFFTVKKFSKSQKKMNDFASSYTDNRVNKHESAKRGPRKSSTNHFLKKKFSGKVTENESRVKIIHSDDDSDNSWDI